MKTPDTLVEELTVKFADNHRRRITPAVVRGWLLDALGMVDARLAAGEQARASLAVLLTGYRNIIDDITDGQAVAAERIAVLEAFDQNYVPPVTEEDVAALQAEIEALQDAVAQSSTINRPILMDTTPADSVGVTETVLYEDRAPDGVMSVDGAVIESTATGVMTAHPSRTRTLRLYLDDNLLFATDPVRTTTAAAWAMRATTIRLSSSTAAILLSTRVGDAYEAPAYIPLSGLTFGPGSTVKLTGQVAGPGADDGEIRCNISYSLLTLPES